MSKAFTQTPKPARPSAEVIAAFERDGAGQDTVRKSTNVQNHESTKAPEPSVRLAVNLSESLHRRFKAACAKTGRKMTTEVEAFIERHTRELEQL